MADRSGRITTHVLDTASGRPAADLRLDLLRRGEGGDFAPIRSTMTNGDGRCEGALLEGEALTPGHYEIRFHVGDYLRASCGGAQPFYETIPVPFVVADATLHYHVPLLLSPFGYATYRGS